MIVSEFRTRIEERTVYFSNHNTETVEADNKNGSLWPDIEHRTSAKAVEKRYTYCPAQ